MQRSGKVQGRLHFPLGQGEPLISSRWGTQATGSNPLNNSALCSLSLALMLSRSLSPFISCPSPSFSHTELISENKRADLISASLPVESEAKSANKSIFIQPTPFVLLGELSQRSLSGWESKGITTCTHTQC